MRRPAICSSSATLDQADVERVDRAVRADDHERRESPARRSSWRALSEPMQDRVLDALLLHPGRHHARALGVHGRPRAPRRRPRRLFASPELVQLRHLEDAGRAPGRPEVDHDRLAAQVREAHGLPVEVGQLEVGGRPPPPSRPAAARRSRSRRAPASRPPQPSPTRKRPARRTPRRQRIGPLLLTASARSAASSHVASGTGSGCSGARADP